MNNNEETADVYGAYIYKCSLDSNYHMKLETDVQTGDDSELTCTGLVDTNLCGSTVKGENCNIKVSDVGTYSFSGSKAKLSVRDGDHELFYVYT